MVDELLLVPGGARLPNDLAIAPEKPVGLSPSGVDVPKDAPSRGPALAHGSARFRVYPCPLTKVNQQAPVES